MLDNFEDVLIQANIAQDEWIFHLKTILTRKYTDLLHSLKLPHDTTYSKAKHYLLEAGDYTATSAGIQLLNPNRAYLKEKTALDFLLQIECLWKRLFVKADSEYISV